MRLTEKQILEVEYNRGKYDGVKEVAEWIESKSTGAEKHPSMSSLVRTTYAVRKDEWQAKLKEWGVNKEISNNIW